MDRENSRRNPVVQTQGVSPGSGAGVVGTHNVCCRVGAELPNNDGDYNKLYNDDIKNTS